MNRSGWRGGWVLLGTLLLSLALSLREPGHFLNPQFWAEDGSVYFVQSQEDGFLRSLLIPFSGYLHTLPRLAAGLALLFPLALSPLIFNLIAFLVQVLPIPYLLSQRLERYLPTPTLRVLAAGLYLAAPNSIETYVSLCNSQWILAFAALLILLASRPPERWLRAGELTLLAIFSVTGPFGAILLPCAVLNLFEHRRDTPKDWWIAQTAVLAAGAVVQVAVTLIAGRSAPGVGPDSAVTLAQGLQIISTHVFHESVLGINRMVEVPWLGHWAASWTGVLTGLTLFVLLAAFVMLQRHRALLSLLYLASVTVLLSFLFPLNDLKLWLKPGFGPRYYLYSALFMLYATLLLCLRGGRLRYLGWLLALVILTVGIPGDFRHFAERPDTQWLDQATVFEYLPQGASLYVPIQPHGYGGITMRRKTPGRDGSALAGLRRLAWVPSCFLDQPNFSRSQTPRLLKFSGMVENPGGSPAPGRVWMVVDSRLYPAVISPAPHRRNTAFARDILLDDVGVGSHRISLILLAPDGAGYYQTADREFSLVVKDRRLVTSGIR